MQILVMHVFQYVKILVQVVVVKMFAKVVVNILVKEMHVFQHVRQLVQVVAKAVKVVVVKQVARVVWEMHVYYVKKHV